MTEFLFLGKNECNIWSHLLSWLVTVNTASGKNNIFTPTWAFLARDRDTLAQKRNSTHGAIYCYYFCLILHQCLFKTWQLPLTTGHYVSAVLRWEGFTVPLRIDTHYQPHKTGCKKCTCAFWSEIRFSNSAFMGCAPIQKRLSWVFCGEMQQVIG